MKKIYLPSEMVSMGSLLLVNENYPYRVEMEKLCLQKVANQANVFLDIEAYDALNNLLISIDGIDKIIMVSGYRSFKEQEIIYSQSLSENGSKFTSKFVAYPGCSEHQTGLAIDLAILSDKIDFLCPNFPYVGISQEFREQCSKFGFIERYGKNKESITKIAHEPWHFRYVGVPHSSVISTLELSLEEYHQLIQQHPYPNHPYRFEMNGIYYAISYIKKENEVTRLEIEDSKNWSISGDNQEGFIYATWE